jgi:CRP/FNR family transcriptional regulator
MASSANPDSIVPAPAGQPAAPLAGDAFRAPVISIQDLRSHCQTCSLRELCLPVGLTIEEMKQVDTLIGHRTRVRKGEALYRAGEPFHALYAVRIGSLKTTVLAEDGREQVTGFHMQGEIVGFDGVGTDCHRAGAVALEDTEVCMLPFISIENLARTMPDLQHILHQVMAREITRGQNMMMMLGSMRAEERLAVFLMNLAERYRRRGYSSIEYELRMARWEIGSYLGLRLETVSRLFSRFQEDGLTQVRGRAVTLVDPAGLKRIIGHRC